MGRHVIWFGPVSREQRKGATLEGTIEHFVSCTGDGAGNTARCRALAEGFGDKDGRHLPGLLRHLNIAEGEELFFGAFSAGGSAVKVLLAHPDDRAAVRAVMLADAVYELRGADKLPASSPSLVAYAAEALADGSRMFVATSSAAPNVRNGQAEPSGAETLARLAQDIEARAGQPFDTSNAIKGADELRPARAWSRGSVILADFATHYAHAEHATRIAPIVWSNVLAPWVDRAPVEALDDEASSSRSSSLGVGLAIGVAAMLAIGIGSALLSSRPALTRWSPR